MELFTRYITLLGIMCIGFGIVIFKYPYFVTAYALLTVIVMCLFILIFYPEEKKVKTGDKNN